MDPPNEEFWEVEGKGEMISEIQTYGISYSIDCRRYTYILDVK